MSGVHPYEKPKDLVIKIVNSSRKSVSGIGKGSGEDTEKVENPIYPVHDQVTSMINNIDQKSYKTIEEQYEHIITFLKQTRDEIEKKEGLIHDKFIIKGIDSHVAALSGAIEDVSKEGGDIYKSYVDQLISLHEQYSGSSSDKSFKPLIEPQIERTRINENLNTSIQSPLSPDGGTGKKDEMNNVYNIIKSSISTPIQNNPSSFTPKSTPRIIPRRLFSPSPIDDKKKENDRDDTSSTTGTTMTATTFQTPEGDGGEGSSSGIKSRTSIQTPVSKPKTPSKPKPGDYQKPVDTSESNTSIPRPDDSATPIPSNKIQDTNISGGSFSGYQAQPYDDVNGGPETDNDRKNKKRQTKSEKQLEAGHKRRTTTFRRIENMEPKRQRMEKVHYKKGSVPTNKKSRGKKTRPKSTKQNNPWGSKKADMELHRILMQDVPPEQW